MLEQRDCPYVTIGRAGDEGSEGREGTEGHEAVVCSAGLQSRDRGIMGTIENRWRYSLTRREALLSLAGMLASSPFLGAQHDPRPLKDHKRVLGLDEMVTAFDFEPVCFANMTQNNYDYMAHGDGDEFTLRRNREAFGWVDLIARPGASVAALNTSREVLGLTLDVPILISPSTQTARSPSRRRRWHVRGRDGREDADDRRERIERPDRKGGSCRERATLVAVLSDQRPRAQPRSDSAVPGERRAGDCGHGRSADLGL